MAGMQILSIKLENYRQYKGETVIDLGCEDSALINVVEGENGAGKSNLLNAITFCFYGVEDHKENNVDDEESELPLVNTIPLGNIEAEESVEGQIEIELGVEEPEYIFRRAFRTFKTEEGEYSDTFDDLNILKKEGTDWVKVEAPRRTRNEILPPNVRQYFFFDAESLRDFFGPNYDQRIRNGILDVSHIELLDRAIDHLKKTRSNIESDASAAKGRPAELQSQINDKEEKLEDLEEQLEHKGEQIEQTRTELSKTESRMQDASSEQVQQLYARRDTLENVLENNQSKLESVIDDTSELILKAGPVVYAHRAIEYGQETLAEMDLPPDIRQEFLEELIEEERCICGEDLSNQPQKLERLKDLRVSVAAVDDNDIKGEYELNSLSESREDLVEELRSNRQQISSLESEIEDVNRQLNEVSEELRAFDIPEEIDVAALEEQREELIERRDSLIREQGKLEALKEEIEAKLDDHREEHRKELNKQEEYKKTVAQLEFVDDTLEELINIRERILSQIRTEVLENMNSYYDELIWKDQSFTIEINDDYSLAVLNEQDQNQLGSLSAGETQVLALSFLAALSQISGFQAPIVIDTPLARISGQPKTKIASSLPNYLKDIQVTLLMTDQEYTSEVEGLLKPSVSNEYELRFSNNRAQVVEQ